MKTVALLLLTSLPLGALAGCAAGGDGGPSADILLSHIDTGRLERAEYDRGKHYLASSDFGLAIDAFEKALAEDGGSADALNGLAIAYDRIGRKEEAQMFLNKALALDPRSAYTLNNLAYFHLSHGERDQAMAYFAQARQALASARTTDTTRTLPTIVANNLAAMSSSEPAAQSVAADVASGAVRPVPVHIVETGSIKAAAKVSAVPIAMPVIAPVTPMVVDAVPAAQPFTASASVAEASKTAPSEVASAPREEGTISQPLQSAITEASPLGHITVRIANLTGRLHMARRFARYLDEHGLSARHLINVRNDNRAQSTIYYSRGLEDAAKAMARLMPVPVRIFGLPNDYRTVELMLAPDLKEFDLTLSSKAST